MEWSDIPAPVNKGRHFIPWVSLLGLVDAIQCEQGVVCGVFFFSRCLCSYLIACQLRCSSPLLMKSFCQLLLLSNSSVTMLNQLFPFVLMSKVIVVQIVCSFHLVSFQSLLLEEINIIWIFLMESVRVIITSACCWSLGVHKHKVQRPNVVSRMLQCLPHSPVNN